MELEIWLDGSTVEGGGDFLLPSILIVFWIFKDITRIFQIYIHCFIFFIYCCAPPKVSEMGGYIK